MTCAVFYEWTDFESSEETWRGESTCIYIRSPLGTPNDCTNMCMAEFGIYSDFIFIRYD